MELDDENDKIAELESISSMPDLIDHGYEAEEAFYNQQHLISNIYNEIPYKLISNIYNEISNIYNWSFNK